jgi:hypothetical protein
MYIGQQRAGRDIRNYEMCRPGSGLDPDVQRQLADIVALVEEAVRSDAVDADRADDLQDATREVIEAASRPKGTRLLRALEYLKQLSSAAAATAGIAEAAEAVVHSVSGM